MEMVSLRKTNPCIIDDDVNEELVGPNANNKWGKLLFNSPLDKADGYSLGIVPLKPYLSTIGQIWCIDMSPDHCDQYTSCVNFFF